MLIQVQGGTAFGVERMPMLNGFVSDNEANVMAGTQVH
jgi:hypothetical protein